LQFVSASRSQTPAARLSRTAMVQIRRNLLNLQPKFAC